MSVPSTEGVPTQGAGEEAVEIPLHGDAAFASLMDALAPEPGGEENGAAAGEAGAGAGAAAPGAAGAAGTADGAGDGQAGRPAAGAGAAAGTDPAAPVAGADGTGADGAAAGGAQGADAGSAGQPAAAGGDGARPAAWTADAASLAPKLGELSTKLEETMTRAYQNEAFEEVREEHSKYFEALNKHPRLLVGQQVPAIGREGTETLRDTNDAREWQEATKSLLIAEVQDRAQRAMEENSDFITTLHASVDLFKNNADLVPGTKNFDVELANRFAALAKPYELRVDEKLQGYSIPVQPIIDQLRTQIQTERAAKPAAPSAAPGTAAPSGGAAAPAKPAPEPPQAGIQSKAGNSGEKEDFSTLFGTIGLPNLQI